MSRRLETTVDTRVHYDQGDGQKEFFESITLKSPDLVEIVVIDNPGNLFVGTRAYKGPFLPDSIVPSGPMILTWEKKFPSRYDAQSSAMELEGRIRTEFPGISVVVKDGLIPVETSAK
jgi:hypothetical protein